jgi:hypothetical protein
MALAQERITTRGPIRDIYGMLDKRESAIKSEQLEHDRLADRQRGECTAEFDFRTSEIQDAALSAETADEHRAKCKESRAQAEANKAQREDTLEEKKAEKARLEGIRQAENALFIERKAEHEAAIAALEAAEALFAEQSEMLTPA